MTPAADRDEMLENQLGALAEVPAPPPSPALDALVRSGGPVRPRSPWRPLLRVALLGFALVAINIYVWGLRTDLPALPASWFLVTAIAWTLAFLVPLGVAILPKRGSVMADSGRAAMLAFLVPAAVLVMSIWLRVDAPGATIIPTADNQLSYIKTCLLSGLEMSAIPFAVSVLVLRRAAAPVSTRWLGAALGAGSGALAGLMLHLHCPIGGAMHVGIAHAGSAVLGALLGALLVPAIVDRGAT